MVDESFLIILLLPDLKEELPTPPSLPFGRGGVNQPVPPPGNSRSWPGHSFLNTTVPEKRPGTISWNSNALSQRTVCKVPSTS